MPANDTVLLERTVSGMAIVKLNRPRVLNAINRECLERLLDVFEEVRRDSTIRIVIFTGQGNRAFSAGADIQYLNQATPLEIREFARLALRVTRTIETLGKVVIAVIKGYALGGGLELAEACMFRIASTDAKLGHPEVKIGAVAGWGGTARLPRLVGRTKATEMLLTGKIITAEEAYEIGLVNKIGSADDVMTLAEALADDILKCAPRAVWLSWEAIQKGMNMGVEEALELGADYFSLAATTKDFREGTGAFLQKRKPKYRGL
ncbi:MAG: enoyl-CoA hydratase [Nitrospirae bacterium]|nr:enoyl-CoA hydratase [Nitrospirota bacterium]